MDTNFEITNGTDTINYDNGVFSGATDLILGENIYGGGAIDSAAEICLVLPEGNYSVKSNELGINCTYNDGTNFVNISTDSAATIDFSGKETKVNGENLNVQALMSFDGSGENSINIDTKNGNNISYVADGNDSIELKTDTGASSEITKIYDCIDTDNVEVSGNVDIDYNGEDVIVTPTPEPTVYISGDADNSGKLEANDAALVLQKVLTGERVELENVATNAFELLDTDKDGKLTARDSAYILQKVLDSTFIMPNEL